MKPKKPCIQCPHLLRQDFDGIPYWRCDRPAEPALAALGRPRGRPNKYGDAILNWLKEYLVDGPKPAGNKNRPMPGTIFGDAIANGFKTNTVWRAAQKLGVHKHKGESRHWFWALPESE